MLFSTAAWRCAAGVQHMEMVGIAVVQAVAAEAMAVALASAEEVAAVALGVEAAEDAAAAEDVVEGVEDDSSDLLARRPQISQALPFSMYGHLYNLYISISL
jgi:hypothetical protein